MGLMHFFIASLNTQIQATPEDSDAWVYFINGQSLPVGTALKSTLSAPLNAPIPRAWIYYKPNATTDNAAAFAADNGNWEQLTTENNQLTDIAALNWYGPELKMAYDLQAYFNRDIYIIKFGIGDTGLGLESGGGILDWDKDSTAELFHRATVDYWIPARDKLIAMGKTPIPKGLFWKQGERDANIDASSLIYESNLEEFIAEYRIRVGNPTMLCVIGLINIHINVRPYFNRVRDAHITVASQANNALNNEDSYTMSADNVHYAEYNTLGADVAAIFIAESQIPEPPVDNFTAFNGSSNFVRFGDILDTVFAIASAKFKLKVTLNNTSLAAGLKVIIGKFAATGNQRSFYWWTDGTDIKFQYLMTVGTATHTRTVTWTGALSTGEHNYELQYDGSTNTNDGLNRCTLLKDTVTQTRTLTGTTGTLGTIFNGTAQLSFGNLVDGAGTPSTFWHNGQAKDMIILSGAGDVMELNIPVLSTGLDISGNARHGTFV